MRRPGGGARPDHVPHAAHAPIFVNEKPDRVLDHIPPRSILPCRFVELLPGTFGEIAEDDLLQGHQVTLLVGKASVEGAYGVARGICNLGDADLVDGTIRDQAETGAQQPVAPLAASSLRRRQHADRRPIFRPRRFVHQTVRVAIAHGFTDH